MKKVWVCFAVVLLLSVPALASANLLVNPSFEVGNPGYHGGLYDGWTFSGNSGIDHTGGAFGGTAEDGNQFAFLQMVSSISQTFTLASSSSVSADFWESVRTSWGNQSQVIAVSLDGTQVGLFPAASLTSMTQETTNPLVLSAGPHTLTFTGTGGTGGDTTAFIDNVNLVTPLPSALLLFAPGLAGLAAIRRRFKK